MNSACRVGSSFATDHQSFLHRGANGKSQFSIEEQRSQVWDSTKATMALNRAISEIENDHVSYIMQLPEADIKQLLSKHDEDGRYARPPSVQLCLTGTRCIPACCT